MLRVIVSLFFCLSRTLCSSFMKRKLSKILLIPNHNPVISLSLKPHFDFSKMPSILWGLGFWSPQGLLIPTSIVNFHSLVPTKMSKQVHTQHTHIMKVFSFDLGLLSNSALCCFCLRCVGGNIVLLIQAFRKKFIIPEFDLFVQKINEIYEKVQKQSDGKVADYIPQLAKFSPELWGVSLCTVDGQRHSVGHTKQPFCLQSCVKPLQYAIAVHESGTEKVHRYVGMEPSGLKFNVLSLDDEDKPHNPMVNAGAILISSLIKIFFFQVMEFVKKMAGQEYVGFSNATFQSEKETGDRNFAIGYYMKEKKCFPLGADMIDALDFYFQLCSIEVTCESGSIMAATLANGGICPITGERVLSTEAVRNTLSLMHSCGMYDFSGQMAFHVGLPAKSGVSGAILLVIPNVMGVMCWSPPLDRVGNSVRGIHFCQELVSVFNFHNYDNLRHFVKKQDPRRQDGDDRNKSVFNLLFAAYSGDVSALRRFALSSMDMDLKDYDSRTALHVAAAEGDFTLFILMINSRGSVPLAHIIQATNEPAHKPLQSTIW
uniref:glutaminase n=1 Tax=Oreochromis niloticus TaxID=8128 RepID=A0A669EQ78_ORENI